MKKKILFVFVPLAFLTLAACAPSTAPSKSASVSSVASLSSNAASAGTSSQNTGALALSSVASKYSYEKVAKGFGEVTLPSSGAQKILVLPIGFTDYAWSSTYSADLEKTLFGMARETGWQSLQSFYATSSHGALSITGKVAEVYKCGLSTSQVINKNDANQTEVDALINAAVASYKNTHTDAKDFDQNGDGYLDGVMAVYAAPDEEQHAYSDRNGTFWAFTSNVYDNAASTSSPTANKYFWASYDFMYEGYGTSKVDAHTFIHESGHMLGLDDYYSYDSTSYMPAGAIDMMDENICDHDAFSKFALGWQKASVLSGLSGSLEVTLRPTNASGDCLLIPTKGGWNGSAFDEYLMVEYYTPDGLNSPDCLGGYSTRNFGYTISGIRIWHIDARLFKVTGETSSGYSGNYTDTLSSSSAVTTMVAHSNSDKYSYVNSSYRLIQLITANGVNQAASKKPGTNASLWTAGKTFSLSSYASQFPNKTKMDDGTSLPYTLKVESVASSGATVLLTYQA